LNFAHVAAASVSNAVAAEFGTSGQALAGVTGQGSAVPAALERGVLTTVTQAGSVTNESPGVKETRSGSATASGLVDIGVFRTRLSAQSESYGPVFNTYAYSEADYSTNWFDEWTFGVAAGECAFGCDVTLRGHVSGVLARGVSATSPESGRTSYFASNFSLGVGQLGWPSPIASSSGVSVIIGDEQGIFVSDSGGTPSIQNSSCRERLMCPGN
jgi:hypothetical protein